MYPKSLKELIELQESVKQDTVWQARYLNALGDVENIIKNKILELEKSDHADAKAKIIALKELLGE